MLRPPVSAYVVAPLGVLLAHTSAYAVIEAGGRVPSHGYLAGVTAIALPVAWGLLILGGLSAIRSRVLLSAVSVRNMALAQMALFLVQETLERSGNMIDAITHPAVIAGLALQPLTAWLVLRAAGVWRLVERVAQGAVVALEIGEPRGAAIELTIGDFGPRGLSSRQNPPPLKRGPPLVAV